MPATVHVTFRIQDSIVLQQGTCNNEVCNSAFATVNLQDNQKLDSCSACMSCQAASIVGTRKQHATQLPKQAASGKSSPGLGVCHSAKQLVACDATSMTVHPLAHTYDFIRALAQLARSDPGSNVTLHHKGSSAVSCQTIYAVSCLRCYCIYLHALSAIPLPVDGECGKMVAKQGNAHIEQVPNPVGHD